MADDIVTNIYFSLGKGQSVDDIVTRLRADWFRPSRLVQDEAADEIERLRAALAVASGMISTMPQYEHQHPESVMEMLLEEARRG